MLGLLSQDVTKPKEAVVHGEAYAGGGATTTVIDYVPCIGASRIDIFIDSSTVVDVIISMSAAAGTVVVDTTLATTAAGVPLAVSFGDFSAAAPLTGALGQVVSVKLTAAAGGTATGWACARV